MDAIFYVVTRGIFLSNGECRRRYVRSVNLRAGKFFGERDGEDAGTGADIGEKKTLASGFLWAIGPKLAKGEAIERDFDDVLGFGPGN